MLDGQVARISFREIQPDAKLENGLPVAGIEGVRYLFRVSPVLTNFQHFSTEAVEKPVEKG